MKEYLVSTNAKEAIQASYTIRDADKIEHRIVYNWPLAAFEELATNCILHKRYESPNYIGIYVYSDRIAFVNHNRPMPPVTIEAMNSQSSFDNRKYLNPELKDMFFALNLIESYGSGIRRAKEALKSNRSPKMEFLPNNDYDDYTMAVIYINEEFAEISKDEKKIIESDKKPIKADKKPIKADKKPIKMERKSLILNYIAQNGSISNREAKKILNLAESTVKRLLKEMVDEGLLRSEGERKSRRYTGRD
ncbi:ATP-binding protein [Candidatus Merdisoma sp. JLR.KK011]|uniref:ATP-binding protein n=1 Tax=Candidatus Merdisoma sp. JLR.KK011 TaxID=3114299 RepID=UPI002FEF5796